MKKTTMFAIAFGLSLVLAWPAAADILVLNNGQVVIGKISTAASGRFKLATEYGDQFFTREEVANFWVTSPGMEAESYYQAGVLLMSKGQRDTARQLFERCVLSDASYRDKCNAALTGGTAAVAPTSPAAGTPGATPVFLPPEPQVQVLRVQCPDCSGTGQVTATSRLGDESGRQRMRPCPLCGGRGFKELQIPQGFEMCSECGGFGATVDMGGGRSGEGGFSMKKAICARCAGRGIMKTPWKPPEQAPGSEGTSPATVGFSPQPGTEPRPTGAYNIARDRARDVAGGNQTSRPIGPSGGGASAEEIVEEERDTDSRSSAGSASGEGSGESSGEETEAVDYSDDDQPGFIGKINKYKWHIVLGGVVLLVFAVVYNKMSAKK